MKEPIAKMTNHRKHVRYSWATEIDIEWSGQRRRATTRNVSLTGVYVAMTDPPPIGELVTIHVRLPGISETWALPSIVRWSEPGDGFGVQFESLRAVEVWAMNKLLHGLAPFENT
jgi:hypothetical protein